MRKLMLVHTAHGVVSLCADRMEQCPWCKQDVVYLCRDKPEAQWVPVNYACDRNEVHDLHRCYDAVQRNDTLRKQLGMKATTWLKKDE